MNKIYLVQTVDVWNDQTLLGFYKNLDDAIDDINEQIFNDEYKLKKEDIKEYPSTFGYCFDTYVGDIIQSNEDDDDLRLQIRGYILDKDEVLDTINKFINDKPNWVCGKNYIGTLLIFLVLFLSPYIVPTTNTICREGKIKMIYEKLYDWQKNIIDTYQERKSFGVFLDMGCGKTPICLAFAERHQADKILIITINSKATEDESVSGSWFWWAKKMDKYYHLLNKKAKPEEFDSSDQIFLVNFEGINSKKESRSSGVELKPHIQSFIKSCKGKRVTVIIDESHRVKDTSTNQTKAISKIKKLLLTTASDFHLYLGTGTPFTQGFIDLHSQLSLLNYPLTKQEFKDRFCVLGNIRGLLGWQQPIKSYKNLDQLYELVHQYAITMKSSEVIKLPEQIFVEHPLPPSPEFRLMTKANLPQKVINDELRKRNLPVSTQDIGVLRPNPFYRNMSYPDTNWFADTSGNFWLRCRQLSIGFQGNSQYYSWFDYSRLSELKKFLSENEDNYILFYNYTPELIEIFDICYKLGYHIDVYCGEEKSLSFYESYEAQSPEQRVVNKKNIIIANFASGSTGKNWQLYSKCIIFSVPLFRDYEQGIKRIHRIGQTETVVYHKFYQENFLDKGMMTALDRNEQYSEDMFKRDLEKGDY